MQLIHWSKDLSVNIKEMDEQHKEFIKFVNKLQNALNENKSYRVARKIINELLSYKKNHFKSEENLMKQYGYHELENHKLEHKKFTKLVSDSEALISKGDSDILAGLVLLLNNWVRYHIEGEDKKYGKYIIGLRSKRRVGQPLQR